MAAPGGDTLGQVRMIGLVIVTHGRLAEEFVFAMEHVVGPQSAVEAICIGPEDDMERRRKDILAACGRVDSTVRVTKDGQTVEARSIMGLMMLAAGPGCCVEIEAEGADAEAAVGALEALVAAKFDEEE